MVNEIDEIAKEKGTPRSQVMEKMLRDWLLKSRKRAIEKDIEAYYLSLTEKGKKGRQRMDKDSGREYK